MNRNRLLRSSLLLNLLFLTAAIACGVWLWFREPVVDLTALYKRYRSERVIMLDIEEPIQVLESEVWCGSAHNLEFQDAKNQKFTVLKLESNGFSDYPPERCRNYLFGPAVPAPAKDLPELLPGSQEERELCGVLARWAEKDPSFHLLLSEDRKSVGSWYRSISSTEERYGQAGYNNHRGLAFIYVFLRTVEEQRTAR